MVTYFWHKRNPIFTSINQEVNCPYVKQLTIASILTFSRCGVMRFGCYTFAWCVTSFTYMGCDSINVVKINKIEKFKPDKCFSQALHLIVWLSTPWYASGGRGTRNWNVKDRISTSWSFCVTDKCQLQKPMFLI